MRPLSWSEHFEQRMLMIGSTRTAFPELLSGVLVSKCQVYEGGDLVE